MGIIYIAVFSVTAIGAVCALVLCIASKFMYVKIDERIVKIEELLPGANCGACGYPGCSGYAKALIADSNVKTNLCSPGGPGVLFQLSEILGVEAGEIIPKTAIVHCGGGRSVQRKKMEYIGIQSCSAAKQLFGGEGACAFGCLGYGDCKTVCPGNAVCIENSLAVIDKRLCTGCGLCVKACPNSLITIENTGIPVSVLCSNIEKGAVARKKCSNACLGDGKCVRECPSGAIVIENYLAKIDYEKCTGCGRCVEVCAAKCILPASG